MSAMPQRRSRVFLAAILVAGWLIGIIFVVPALIRAAYAGTAPAFLNRIIVGQAQHPVEEYLEHWWRLAWQLSLGVLVGSVAAAVLWRHRQRVTSTCREWLRGEPTIGVAGVLWGAVFWGGVGGWVEGVHIVVRKIVAPLSPSTWQTPIAGFWGAPIGEALVMLALALVFIVVVRAWRRPVSPGAITFLCVWVLAYGFLEAIRAGLALWSIHLLAVGIAIRAATWARSRADWFRRRAPVSVAVMLALSATAGATWEAILYVRERRALARLPNASPDAPNVLLLVLDTGRAASLGLYGAPFANTPNLERLAAEGTVFMRAVSTSSWTLPSHASMFSGWYPWQLTAGRLTPLGPERPILGTELSKLGYASAGFVGNHGYAGRTSGLGRGFTYYFARPRPTWLIFKGGWLSARIIERIHDMSPEPVDAGHYHSRQLHDELLTWLDARGDRPFLGFINYFDAHVPYFPPESLFRALGGPKPSCRVTPFETPERIAAGSLCYAAAIGGIDQEIGHLVEQLRQRGLLDRTALIITADHGEQFAEHSPRLVEHGNSMYYSSIHVPLLIRYPPRVPAGLRVERTVSTRRIAATIMDLVGRTQSPFPGPSLAAEWGESPVDQGPALSDVLPCTCGQTFEPIYNGRVVSAVEGDWHYIRNGDGTEELYDVAADPWERNNRAGEPGLDSLQTRLREALNAGLADSLPTGP